MSRILEELGVYGCSQANETAFFASMLTGDPILLIGAHGTKKTGLAKSIAAALKERSKRANPDDPSKWFSCATYDCSKLNFEDICGFPNPKALSEGEIDFVRSPMTAWNKDMVVFDEFNRQTPERQNNIFEITRSRTLQGIPTNTKFVIACMNPYGMAGTEILDEALVDRMSFYLYIQPFSNMSDLDRESVIDHVSPDDAPALRSWLNKTYEFDFTDDATVNEALADVGETIFTVLNRAAEFYEKLEKESGEAYSSFVNKIFTTLDDDMSNKDWKIELSGRRAGLIRRALLAYRAVDLAMSEHYTTRSVSPLKTAFFDVFERTLPIGVSNSSGSSVPPEASASIMASIERYSQFFEASDPYSAINSLDVIYELLTTDNIVRKVHILTKYIDDELASNQVWTNIVASAKDSEDKHHFRNNLVVAVIANLVTVNDSIVPDNIKSVLASNYPDALSVIKAVDDKCEIIGSCSLFEDQINAQIDKLTDPFVRMQARVMWHQFSRIRASGDVRDIDIQEQKTKVRIECEVLQEVINNAKKQDKVHNESLLT